MALSLLLALAGSPVYGQAGAAPGAPGAAVAKYKAHDPYVVVAVRLKKPPDLPFMPVYQPKGLLFVDGISHPRMAEGKKCVQCRYRTKDSVDALLGFYQEALKSNGWTLATGQNSNSTVIARKDSDGLIVFIYARSISQAGYHCEYLVRYLIIPAAAQPSS